MPAPMDDCGPGPGLDGSLRSEGDVLDASHRSVESDLRLLGRMTHAFDFSAWDDFRTSLPREERMAIKIESVRSLSIKSMGDSASSLLVPFPSRRRVTLDSYEDDVGDLLSEEGIGIGKLSRELSGSSTAATVGSGNDGAAVLQSWNKASISELDRQIGELEREILSREFNGPIGSFASEGEGASSGGNSQEMVSCASSLSVDQEIRISELSKYSNQRNNFNHSELSLEVTSEEGRLLNSRMEDLGESALSSVREESGELSDSFLSSAGGETSASSLSSLGRPSFEVSAASLGGPGLPPVHEAGGVVWDGESLREQEAEAPRGVMWADEQARISEKENETTEKEREVEAAQQFYEVVPKASAEGSEGAAVADDTANGEACGDVRGCLLSDEERYDNALWRLRLMDGAVFEDSYVPQEWERKEMDKLIEFLELRPGAATRRGSWEDRSDSERGGKVSRRPIDDSRLRQELRRKICRRAIDSIFFPKAGAPRSVLLKRGPVLLNGEERELTLFTHGILFSRVELDVLVSLLLDGNAEGVEDLTSEQLRERFRIIDADHSGSIDRGEINDFFRGMGMPLSGPALDNIMNEYDLDSDGTISLEEFKSVMHQTKTQQRSVLKSKKKLKWRLLGTKLRGALGRTGVTRKLDAAFRMADIRMIENLGVAHSDGTKAFADSAWAHLTLALHIRGQRTPLLVTCTKPGHVEAWMEAFQACVSASAPGTMPPAGAAAAQQEEILGVIWGVSEARTAKVVQKKQPRKQSIFQWRGTNVDWAGSSDQSNDNSLSVSG